MSLLQQVKRRLPKRGRPTLEEGRRGAPLRLNIRVPEATIDELAVMARILNTTPHALSTALILNGLHDLATYMAENPTETFGEGNEPLVRMER